MATAGAIFLTGATGFIGGELLRRLLARDPGARIYALVRARDDVEAASRGREVFFKLFQDDRDATEDAKRRVRWVRGDASAAGLGLAPPAADEIAAETTEVFHAAASTEFDLPLEQARAVNFEGARQVCGLAERIARGGRLARLAHFSTAYVAGTRTGRCLPEDLPPDRASAFNNTYERTKAEAERYLRARAGDLPITVLRPSIVVGDSATGRTYNFNVLYYPIKLIHRGALTHIPGYRTTTLDIVPVDYVCDAALALARDPAATGRTFHITADEDAIPLRRFLDIVVDLYNRERARLNQPLLSRVVIPGRLRWRFLSWAIGRRLAGRAKEQFQLFLTYLPYVFTEKRFDATATRAALAGKVAYPPCETYLERIAAYAVTREWGRRVSWDPSLMMESSPSAGT